KMDRSVRREEISSTGVQAPEVETVFAAGRLALGLHQGSRAIHIAGAETGAVLVCADGNIGRPKISRRFAGAGEPPAIVEIAGRWALADHQRVAGAVYYLHYFYAGIEVHHSVVAGERRLVGLRWSLINAVNGLVTGQGHPLTSRVIGDEVGPGIG